MRPRQLFTFALLAATLLGCQSAQSDTLAPATLPARAPGPAATSATVSTLPTPDPAEESERLLDEPTRRVVRFTNGITLLLQQNKAAPVVATRIFVKAGSLTEGPHTGAGLSHIVEHLVASASSGKRPQAENTLLLLQIGNDSNAFTDADQTCYFITTTPDKFPIAAELLVDLTTNSTFTRQQFDREFKVVQRELEMDEAQSDQVFYTHALANRYLVSPARFPIVGTKAAFQTLTFEDCQAYYRAMYVPDNMVISVAGDIDLDATQTFVRSQIRTLRRRPAPAIARPPEPPVLTPRVSVAHADLQLARIQWAFPTAGIDNPDMPALDLLAGVLGGGDSSPLVRKLREERALVSTISSIDTTPRFADGQLEINATLEPQKIPAAQEALFALLDDLLKNGITDQALARAQAQALANIAFDFQSADQQASRNAEDFLIAANLDFTRLYAQRLQAVTRDQLLAAARKYLSRDHLLTTLLLPLNAPNPLAPKPAAAGNAPAGDKVAVKRILVDNGITLLISRNPAAPLACFNLYTLGGLLAEDDATSGIGAVMMNLIARESSQRSHRQVTDFLDSTGTTVIGTAGNNVFQLSMACLSRHAAESFQLFAEMALHPKFSPEELALVRPSVVAAVDVAAEDWSSDAYRALRDVYYASSPYKRMADGNAAVIDKLTPAQITRHYNTYFLNPAHLVIAISGDIDPDAAEKWAAPFRQIPAPARQPNYNLFSVTNEAAFVVRPTDKASATVMLAYPGSTMTSPDRNTLTLLKTYLGGYSSPAGSLLHETLRAKGLVYTVKAKSIPGPAGGMFLITALGQPQNATTIAATIQALIEDVKKGNLPDPLFNAAKDQAITGRKLDQPTVADISSRQALNETLGIGYDDDNKFPDQLRAISKPELIRIANKYLTTPTLVILTPDAK